MAKSSGGSGRVGGKLGGAGRESGYSGSASVVNVRRKNYLQYEVTEPSGDTLLYDERGRHFATIPAKLTATSYAIGRKRD